MFTVKDEEYMKITLELAARAKGKTSPNPLVGAVVVKAGRIIGQGYHQQAGTPHAEIHALNQAGQDASGAHLYVNLEPCSHQGRTPACVERIIKEKVARVYIGITDPNPLVNGNGITRLKAAGIQVYSGLLADKSRRLNRIFCKYITTGLPYITLKSAVTMDGKICTFTGDSKWITNPLSREYVHRLRSYRDGILTGISTVLKDNPRMTARLPGDKTLYPYRIILDSRLQIPLDAKILGNSSPEKVIIATTEAAPRAKIDALKGKGIRIEKMGSHQIDLPDLLRFLGSESITSLLIESGGTLNAAFLQNDLLDEIFLFIAPKIIGGQSARTFIEGTGLDTIQKAYPFSLLQVKRFDDDIMLHYERRFKCSQE